MTVPWTNSIALLVILPMIAGVVLLTLVNQRRVSRVVGTASFTLNLGLCLYFLMSIRGTGPGGATGHLVTQMSGWPAPYGISLVFDAFAGLLLAAAAMVCLASYIHSFSSLDQATERRYYHPLIQFLMMGVNMSFLTGDLFNLFVAFEVMLLSSYCLLSLGASRKQMSQAYKYVLLNLLGSTVFVMAAGMTYGMFGTLNMAELARIVRDAHAAGTGLPTGFTALGILLLFVFALKGAFFPLWFWLPDTYWTCPVAIAGLFGGLLTKVGVYAVARLFPMVFASGGVSQQVIAPIIAISAAFTMFLAVLGAVSQHNVRRILSVHVISQVGYMVFGIAIGVGASVVLDADLAQATAGAAMAGCAFYMIQHMVVKCSLFLCCGVMEKHAGTDDLDSLGGLLKRDVWLGVLFFIAAMSLVGLPPLSGFFGKLVVIREGFRGGARGWWWLSVLGLLTGALTLLSMLKIWSYGFWDPAKAPTVAPPAVVKRGNRSAYFGITMLVVTALFLGFGAELVYDFAWDAGAQLVEPTAYIEAVLPDDHPGNVVDVVAEAATPSGHEAAAAEGVAR